MKINQIAFGIKLHMKTTKYTKGGEIQLCADYIFKYLNECISLSVTEYETGYVAVYNIEFK